jgi:polysaccharide biosynthesis protein PslH
MKILALWHDLPNPYTGDSLPIFNLLKYLARKHEISWLSFKQETAETRYNNDMGRYCQNIETVSLANLTESESKQKQIRYIAALPFNYWFSARPFTYQLFFSPEMQSNVNHLVSTRKFDLIYTSIFMAYYINNSNFPKVVHQFDCVTEMAYRQYLSANNLSARCRSWINYKVYQRYERSISNNVDACLVVSPTEQQRLKAYFPKANPLVIPNGVDSQYFSPDPGKEEYPSLIFVGNMGYPPNIDAMLFFCKQIYPRIKDSIPDIKLTIVGRSPVKEIIALSVDKSIVVTGYVEDVRPYVARASVVVTPFVSGIPGIKNKVLEAMSMAKPVVSTSIGVQGITMANKDDVMVTDDPGEFARQVINLLNDRQLRQIIGNNGRKLVTTRYSWETMASQLDDVFTKVVHKCHR